MLTGTQTQTGRQVLTGRQTQTGWQVLTGRHTQTGRQVLTGRQTQTGRQENREAGVDRKTNIDREAGKQSTSTGVATASASPWMRAVKSTSYTELAPDAVFRKLMDQSITRPESAELKPREVHTCCYFKHMLLVDLSWHRCLWQTTDNRFSPSSEREVLYLIQTVDQWVFLLLVALYIPPYTVAMM